MITTHVRYRRAIYSLLYLLKNSTTNSEFNALMKHLDKTMKKHLPENKLENSQLFFKEVTRFLLKILEDYYEIEHGVHSTSTAASDVFTLTPKGSHHEMQLLEEKYTAKNRFWNYFLREFDYEYWKDSRSNYRRYDSIGQKDENGKITIRTNEILLEGEYFLPKNRYGQSMELAHDFNDFVSMLRQIRSVKMNVDNIIQNHQRLLAAIEEFNKRIEQLVKNEELKFYNSNLKSLLSRILIPVSALLDEEVKNACLESGRKVFIKKPSLADFLSIGASVYVYSAHDLDDDSSYMAKPIEFGQKAGDSEQLKFHGIGQVTGINADCERSLGGNNPYVINHNIYVSANQEDFLAWLPEPLQDEIKFYEDMMSSLDKDIGSVQYNPLSSNTLSIEGMAKEVPSDVKQFINSCIASMDSSEREEEQAAEESEYEFEVVRRIEINSFLFRPHPLKDFQFAIFEDEAGNIAGVKTDRNGRKLVYQTQNADEVLKAMQLPDGVYAIHHFSKRMMNRQQAIKRFYPYKEKREATA
ncbi:hypothetical protein [Cytobacillus oceanisediminis]|uniref:hypothetical protein n=1 Tax=Cytobacillus oceanisediminis TaxID=665099 RepID=UPI001FB37550|nr:hypothetical protein [Cytobacillus oceanisediminis]UOE58130.1 hypothetical protein IRB79_26855 [Cytobacillus oceanisediminis]